MTAAGASACMEGEHKVSAFDAYLSALRDGGCEVLGSQLISKHSDNEFWIALRPCVKGISPELLQESKMIRNRLCEGTLPRTCRTTKPTDVH